MATSREYVASVRLVDEKGRMKGQSEVRVQAKDQYTARLMLEQMYGKGNIIKPPQTPGGK
jgi:hypothetical protein